MEKVLSSERIKRSSYGKRIVFLDEFPWFATKKSDFLEAFGEFWNRYGASQGDMMMIICGSATSWIIGNIIENTGSMYNRVTCQIFLHPFTLQETELMFQAKGFGWSRRQIAECQMIFGGLPYFLDQLNENESLPWNVDHLCFEQDALLRSETKRLLETTLKKSDIYDRILKYLAQFTYGIETAKCQRELNIPHTSFLRAVDDLKKCRYILEYKGYYNKGIPSRIQLIDPFLLFHYHFIVASEAAGEMLSFSDLKDNEGLYHNWLGHAFETLCLYHIEEIKSALGISGVRANCYPWVSDRKKGGAQIDLVIERADQLTNICELKFTDHPFSMDAEIERDLLHKVQVYREETDTAAALKPTMITFCGITGTAYTERISKVLTLDDLFG